MHARPPLSVTIKDTDRSSRRSTIMEFVVTLKGLGCFLGKFSDACEFIRRHWGSVEAASEKGVRLIPASRYRLAADQ